MDGRCMVLELDAQELLNTLGQNTRNGGTLSNGNLTYSMNVDHSVQKQLVFGMENGIGKLL